jgi:hypothetical protein
VKSTFSFQRKKLPLGIIGIKAVGIRPITKKNNILSYYEITLFKLTNVNLIVNFNLLVGKGCFTYEIYSLFIRLINLALINKIFRTCEPKRNFIFNVKFIILF